MVRTILATLAVLTFLSSIAWSGDIRTDGKLISTEPTDPPLEVTSTALVTNLNADLLDGMDALQVIQEASDEVRIAIDSVPFTISSPGSYYLTGNLTMTTADDAITVAADSVTLDLGGFTIDGGGVGSRGIYMEDRRNVEIRNGTVRGFTGSGVVATGLQTGAHRVMDLRSEENGEYGIFLGGSSAGLGGLSPNHLVVRCLASGNGTTTSHHGIYVPGGVVTHNTAEHNAGTGILAGNINGGAIGATVTFNLVSFNGRSGIRGVHSTVIGNSAIGNARNGIDCMSSLVRNNTAVGNNSDESTNGGGIRIQGACQVVENTLQFNRQAGINATHFSGSVIERNYLYGSDPSGVGRGLWLQSTENFYSGNRATRNATDYDIAAGNTDGGGNVSY